MDDYTTPTQGEVLYRQMVAPTITIRPAHWFSAEEDAVLMKLWAEGVVAREIGLKLGITKSAVLGRRRRLGLPNRVEGHDTAKPWTSEDEAQLRVLWDEGHIIKEIAARMGRTFQSVQRRAATMRLPRRVRGGTPEVRRRRYQLSANPPPPIATDHRACQYPISGEGKHTQFCGADSQVGKPYCPAHTALCLVTPPQKNLSGNQIDRGPLCAPRR